MYGVIYKLTNTINGKSYVGKTTQSLGRRISGHKSANTAVGRAIRKHGVENFTIEVLEECHTPEQLNEREIFWIAKLNCKAPKGYNCTAGGDGLISPSEETIEKMKASSKNRWERGGDSPETLAKKSAAHKGEKNPFYGKHHTKAARLKISIATQGNKNMLGKHHTAETCAKLSASKRGKSPYKNLLDAISELQISYRSLAKLLSLSQSIFSRKMRGERNFTAKDIAKLVKIFNKPAEYLMARE